MKKPALALKIEKERKARIPKKGAKVFYPVPMPPVGEDGTPNPSRSENWYPAVVVKIEQITRTEDPDDWQAVIQPDEGMELALAVSLLRSEPPTEDELPPMSD